MMKKSFSDRIYRINKEVAHREIEDEAVLLLPHEGYSMEAFNESGKFVWLQILKGKPPSKIAKSLAREFGIPPKRAEKDTLEFIKSLKKRKIII